jgi:hypothetical protein
VSYHGTDRLDTNNRTSSKDDIRSTSTPHVTFLLDTRARKTRSSYSTSQSRLPGLGHNSYRDVFVFLSVFSLTIVMTVAFSAVLLRLVLQPFVPTNG